MQWVKRLPERSPERSPIAKLRSRSPIGDLFSNGDRDHDRDLKIDEDQDRHRDRIFRDRTNTLHISRIFPSWVLSIG